MIFSWLLIIILAYFFFSLSYLGDKLILSGPPKPNAYTFYVGTISIFVVVMIPFIHFELPPASSFAWIVGEAIVYILGLWAMFTALAKFDVSRVMTTIGATQPLFIFGFSWLLWGPQPMGEMNIVAFVLLVIGSSLISFEPKSKTNKSYILVTLIASLLFSFDYIFSKMVFLSQPFLQGFVWMRIFVFLFALLFLIAKNNRKEIFKKQSISDKKIWAIFVGTHTAGGLANVLQGFAISLAPIAFLPIVNSLRGIQYVFLFLITVFISVFFPKILKEEMAREIIIQKIISIILIVAGLAILVA